MKKNYSVTTNDELRSICIRKNWFTGGSIRQYEKLFYANENGYTVDEIATIIWLCSDEEKPVILSVLKQAKEEYAKVLMETEQWEQLLRLL